MAKHAALALAVVVFSLGAGMAGYVYFEKLSWLDGFLNAAMLLGGMGPVESPQTTGGKLFAGCTRFFSSGIVPRLVGLLNCRSSE